MTPPRPALDANAAACARTAGSRAACAVATSRSTARKCPFSLSESGDGGRAAVVPMAREAVAGVVARRESRCVFVRVGCGWMYFWGRGSLSAHVLLESPSR